MKEILMPANHFVEKYRKYILDELKANSFSTIMKEYWITEIEKKFNEDQCSLDDLYILGDHLRSIFSSTTSKEENSRSQSFLSTAGHVFECLITWYVNLGLIGTDTVVIKYKKDFVPNSIRDALTVTYGSNTEASNSESDIIAITFSNIEDYITENNIDIKGINKRDFFKIVNDFVDKNFAQICVNVIQCKTNWNDNAQIPMAWDIIYSATSFDQKSKVKVGIQGRNIHQLLDFKYSFVTVPSQKDTEKYNSHSVAVQRVNTLSGHNFWCKETTIDEKTKKVIAYSISEIFELNFKGSFEKEFFEERIKNCSGIENFINDFK